MTLESLRAFGAGESYPRALLERCETALVLFAAGFHGRQDAVWIADAGLTATCVDLDVRRLGEMEGLYPDGWEYVPGDAYVYASLAERRWDLVSLDPPSDQFRVCADALECWCALANEMVVIGCGATTALVVPEGWGMTDFRRRSDFVGGVFWAVLERV